MIVLDYEFISKRNKYSLHQWFYWSQHVSVIQTGLGFIIIIATAEIESSDLWIIILTFKYKAH